MAPVTMRGRLPLTFLERPSRPAVGLNALDPADWLWPDERYGAEMAERERLLLGERPGEVLALLPGAGTAAAELLGRVVAFLLEHHPGRFRREGPAADTLLCPDGRAVDLADPHPLRAAGRLVQEDLCLMQPPGPGEPYALTGAALCFPAHWRLADKLGRPLSAIHAPVPGFAERLGRPVDRLFAGLAAERPVWRANWSVVESPELFHPGPRAAVPDLTAEDAGRRLWLRVERQTLRRLPRTSAVVFTIRTLVRPVGEVAVDPAVAAALAARLRELDPGTAAYKGLPALAPALLGWLDRRAGGAAAGGAAAGHAPAVGTEELAALGRQDGAG